MLHLIQKRKSFFIAPGKRLTPEIVKVIYCYNKISRLRNYILLDNANIELFEMAFH